MDFIKTINIRKLTPFIVLLVLELMYDVSECATQAEINRHLEAGREYLQRNQLADALREYHAAVEGDPTNYLTNFKRGTVYLALGRARLALQDFGTVLELKPDFTAARLQRGSVLMKLGEYDSAYLDLYNVLSVDPYNEDANVLFQRVHPAQESFMIAHELKQMRNFDGAIRELTNLLEISPWSSEIRHLRADCYLEQGEVLSAVSDLRAINRLQQDSIEGYFKLSKLLYQAGFVAESLKEIRECLRLDPEHKDCFPLYKKIKKIDKFLNTAEHSLESGNFGECIEQAGKVLKAEDTVIDVIFNAKKLLCSCYVKDEQYTVAIGTCRAALEIHQDPSIMCDRADAYIGTEMYDDAIHDYKSALEINEHDQRAKDGLLKAQRLQKQAERRDYYKILGVKRTATKQEIIKAYRKAAQKWHPDNFKDDEKKIAENKFIDIAAAKEVLTDPEKRAQFDNGEDPLDPESANNHRGGGGSPFHHFHHGSPFQFKFHFN
ncbi:dnaJ homolog subfamily C member 3-like isoform X1 [Ctenocephalides felis]|uniref:dnaJ homolog subfamily C member 3-like isoform X1 n=1 Tax=Ctenocephalides felis TaxID=7515 RepID=UPI000E6E1502|nr:dnaJ homolog subfamily C member 3-like isoform X1 [Ctenocephalides felis]